MKASFKTFWRILFEPSRAPRMAIRVPLAYRCSAEVWWLRGVTVNISRSGVLFQAEQPVEVGTPVEINFDEPIDIGEVRGTAVSCRGDVVRSMRSLTTEAPSALAARVSLFQFKPHPTFDIRKYTGDERGPMAKPP